MRSDRCKSLILLELFLAWQFKLEKDIHVFFCDHTSPKRQKKSDIITKTNIILLDPAEYFKKR